MDMRLLRHFIAVAESGTLTEAAEKLGLAQSAVSQSLGKLEKEIGARLFVRSHRGAELTSIGRSFLEDSLEALAMLDAATVKAQQSAEGRAGRFTAGFAMGAAYGALPKLLKLLRAQLPHVEVVLKEIRSGEQADALRACEIDIGLAHRPVSVGRRIREMAVSHDELIAAVPMDFASAARDTVSVAELAQRELIAFPSRELPELRIGLVQAYEAAGCKLRVGVEVNRALTALACVAAGYGVALVPRYASMMAFGGVRYLKVRAEDKLPAVIVTALWRASSRAGIADHLVSLMREAQ